MTVVYALQIETWGPIKIGCTKACGVTSRMQMVQHGSPWPLRCIAVWDGTRKDEQAAHSDLAAHRMRGEWFKPEPEVFAYLSLRAPDFGFEKYLERVFRVAARKEIQKVCGSPRHNGARQIVEHIMAAGPFSYGRWCDQAQILPDDVIERGLKAARDIASGKIPTITNPEWRRRWAVENALASSENRAMCFKGNDLDTMHIAFGGSEPEEAAA